MSIFGVVGTIGAASAPWIAQFLMTIHKVLPFTVMGVLSMISSALCFKLKETIKKTTAETLEEIEGENKKEGKQHFDEHSKDYC